MRKKYNELWLHVLICVILVVIPFMIQIESTSLSVKFMVRFWLMVFGLILTFYSNYIYAIDKLFYRKKYLEFVLFNIAIFALTDFMSFSVEYLFDFAWRWGKNTSGVMQTMFIYNKLIFTALGVGSSMAVRYYKRLSDSEVERKRLETEHLTSEISMLKYQMQPHFFFNTLNNIYSLISKSPSDAQKAVHSLSKMMRYILYENTADIISLSKELEFIENYNKLMLLRVTGNVRVNFSFPDNVDNVNVPPLLLIPLIENAYKHGVSAERESFIESSLRVEDGMLHFEVVNCFFAKEGEDCSHSGIGIANLCKRLEILYGGKSSFNYGHDGNGRYVAQLTIPLS